MIQVGSKEEVAFIAGAVRHTHPAGEAAGEITAGVRR
ncbi:hypothetical protein ACVWXL_004804 [Bradyrhizobium sp. GM22.5]